MHTPVVEQGVSVCWFWKICSNEWPIYILDHYIKIGDVMYRNLWIENNAENPIQIINKCQEVQFTAIPNQENITYVSKPAPKWSENSGCINVTFLHVSNEYICKQGGCGAVYSYAMYQGVFCTLKRKKKYFPIQNVNIWPKIQPMDSRHSI